MLQSIRDKTQGWIAGIIVSILILSFALWGIHSYLVGGSTTDVVAKVNGVAIQQNQLSLTYQRLKHQLELEKNNTLLPNSDLSLKNKALQSLINLQVLKQASLNQDYRISLFQAENFLQNMPDFQVNGQFSIPRFQQMLNAALFTTNEFLELIKSTLLIDQPRLGLIFSSFALSNEVSYSIYLINEERNIDYVVLPFNSFVNPPIVISSDKIQAYYNQHTEEFNQPEQVSVDYILLSINDIKNKIKVTDEEYKNYYNENAASFDLPAKWKWMTLTIPLSKTATASDIQQAEKKANDIYKKVVQGQGLNALAAQNALIQNIHLYDYTPLNEMPLEIQHVFLSSPRSAQILKPIKTENGFLVIKIVDYKKPEAQPFNAVKQQVQNTILMTKATEEFVNEKDKLANITYEHPDSLKPAADALGLPIQTSENFTKEQGNQTISTSSRVRDAAFSSDVLLSKNNSDVVPLNSDAVVVLRVKSHFSANRLPLNKVQDIITEKLKANEVENRASKLVNDILLKLQSTPNNMQDILKQNGLTWANTGFITRHSTKINAAILNTAFDLPILNGRESFGIAKIPNGYAVVGLRAIKPGELTTGEVYGVFSEQVQNTQGLLEYELYKESLIKQAKIVMTEQ